MGLAEYGVGDSQISFITGLKTMLGKDAPHAFRHGVRQVGRGGPELQSRAGGAVEHRAAAAGQHQARRGARRTPALGRDGRRAGPRGPARARTGGARGGRRRLRPRRVPQLPRPRRRTGAWASSRSRARFSCWAASMASSPITRAPRSDDSATVAAYRADLATIASDSVLREFDHRTGRNGPPTCKDFWTTRDRAELRADGERLREHYRRLFYARKNFQLTALNRHYDIVERYRSGSRDFDDRGIIYIRHGEPSSRATYAAPGLEPNESWRYSRPDGDLLFHFVAREDVQDFKLVESLFDVLGFSQQVVLRGGQCAAGIRWPSSSSSRASSCRPSTGGCSRPDRSAADSTRPRSGGWGRRASRWEPRPTATSCDSPRSSGSGATSWRWGTTRRARWSRSPTPSRGRASSR